MPGGAKSLFGIRRLEGRPSSCASRSGPRCGQATSIYSNRTPKLTDKDTIVLADFTNTTGDTVIRWHAEARTLCATGAVTFPQPHLRWSRPSRLYRMMGQPQDAKLTFDIAREICQRTVGVVVLDGSIPEIGTQYNLILKAVNCSSGESLASTEAQASDKNHVLDALGRGRHRDAGASWANRWARSKNSIRLLSTPPHLHLKPFKRTPWDEGRVLAKPMCRGFAALPASHPPRSEFRDGVRPARSELWESWRDNLAPKTHKAYELREPCE